jgi:hypothetical protein
MHKLTFFFVGLLLFHCHTVSASPSCLSRALRSLVRNDRSKIIEREARLIQDRLAVNVQLYLKRFSVSSEIELGKKNASALGMSEEEYSLFKTQVLESMEIRVNTKPNIRSDVAEKGFLNQYDTKTSGGINSPGLRHEREAGLLGLSSREYKKLESVSKPKYGSVTLSGKKLHENVGVDIQKGAQGRYGLDSYVLKPQAIERISFFVNDSLLWTMNPNEKLGHFIPLSNTDVFIHSILDNAKMSWKDFRSVWVSGNRSLSANEMRSLDFADFKQISPSSKDAKLLYFSLQLETHPYIETQIWGKLDTRSVKAVYLDPAAAASKEILRNWQSQGIEVYKLKLDGPGATSLELIQN